MFCIPINFFATIYISNLIMCLNDMLIFAFRTRFGKSSEIYSKQGQFKYDQSDFTSDSIQQLILETTNNYNEIYLGQLKEGTNIKEGIGIRVASSGHTLKLNNNVYMRDIGRIINGMEKGDIQQIQIQINHLKLSQNYNHISTYI